MNANLRRIFNIVVALMAILGISSSIIMVVRSSSLNADPRNVRALYNELPLTAGRYSPTTGAQSWQHPRK